MKTKLEMAHEWYMKHGKDNVMEKSIACAWQYADAMQAEADKRAHKEPRETHKNLAEFNMHPEYDASINYPPDAWVMHKGEKRLAASIDIEKEWQPDWSQAPEHANIWQKSSANNYYWCCDDHCLGAAPSFGYTGDWRESLRKRPK